MVTKISVTVTVLHRRHKHDYSSEDMVAIGFGTIKKLNTVIPWLKYLQIKIY